MESLPSEINHQLVPRIVDENYFDVALIGEMNLNDNVFSSQRQSQASKDSASKSRGENNSIEIRRKKVQDHYIKRMKSQQESGFSSTAM